MTATFFRWSLDDWHELVNSGILANKKVELLEGEIVQMSPEGIPHRHTNHEIVKYLRQLLGDGAEVYEAHPVTLDESEPEPDIAIVRSPSLRYRYHHPFKEDIYWLIEISKTTLNQDLGQKADIYARNDIAEYWVIDLSNQKMFVHTQPNNGKYQKINEYTTGFIQPLAFSGIEIDLSKLLIY